jgi:hypothetical protein
MNARTFDAVSKYFADRRLSRRQAVIQGGTALAATGLAITGLAASSPARTASAQDATPVPADTLDPSGVDMLFVQTYQAGSITPKEGVADRYTLALEAGTGQTIYFSDRPDRIVGAAPTADFFGILGFHDDNPPNAALVIEPVPGETDIAVIELFTPVYDEATQGVTYEIEVLANWQTELEIEFSEAPTDLAALVPSFGAAHLFIDGLYDCPDSVLTCYISVEGGHRNIGDIPNEDHDGFCVQRPSLLCGVCKQPEAGGGWQAECNRRFADCNGQCDYFPKCTGYWCP